MVYPVGVVDNYLPIVDGVDSGESEPHHLDYAPTFSRRTFVSTRPIVLDAASIRARLVLLWAF